MPVQDAIGRAVERHVVGGARPGFGATALEQQTREHDQLGALRVALAVEELNAERQLAAGPPRRLEQPVCEPSGVAVRLAEEGFRADSICLAVGTADEPILDKRPAAADRLAAEGLRALEDFRVFALGEHLEANLFRELGIGGS